MNNENEKCPASPAEDAWFLGHQTGYSYPHTVAILRLVGKWQKSQIQRAIAKLKSRHPAVNTRFAVQDSCLVPQRTPGRSLATAIQHLPEGVSAETGVEYLIQTLAREPIDPFTSPPSRFHLIPLSGSERLLVLVLHHLATDSVSQRVLFRDLSALLLSEAGEQLPQALPALTPYRSCAARQYAELENAGGLAAIDAIAASLATRPLHPGPALSPKPRDHYRALSSRAVVLDSALVSELSSRSVIEQIPLALIGLTAFCAVLSAWMENQTVWVELPFHGRMSRDAFQVAGLFADSTLLQVPVDPSLSLRALAWVVRARLRDPSATCLTNALLRTHPQRLRQLPQITFDCSLQAAPGAEAPGTTPRPAAKPSSTVLKITRERRAISLYAIEKKIFPNDSSGPLRVALAATLQPKGSEASLAFEYDNWLFSAATIDAQLAQTVALLRAFAADPANSGFPQQQSQITPLSFSTTPAPTLPP